jgi:16S rRNA (cytosine967-C5)-methyltransferase
MKISPARVAAFDILKRVQSERAYTSVLLPEYEERLSPVDRALCHELTLGVLRRQIWLDRSIDLLTNGTKLDLAVRIALRLGLYQIRFLSKIPAHAAVSESVELVRRAKKTSAKGLVNAVLRRLVTDPVVPKPTDETDRIVLDTSHPRWLVEHWTQQFGIDEAGAIASANNSPAPIAFRLLCPVDIGAEVPRARASAHVAGCFLSEENTPELRALGAANKVYFQDEASQMVARSVEVPADGRFLDVCASPGGKTGLIAASFPNAAIVAGDIHRSRVELLRSNLIRQGCSSIQIAQYDAASSLPFADASFDSVLVDAPCSGTGTIRRNPEIRYSLRPQDLVDLPEKQLSILRNAWKSLKNDGTLVYSTCSLEPEENEGVASAFAKEVTDAVPVTPNVPPRFLTAESRARTWPHRDGMDGFFVTAFQKRASNR